MMNERKFQINGAFTLAEILITLAVIGIVAAITIPALIQSYQKRVASTRLKKFYSVMTQAIRLSEIENGSVEQWTRTGNLKDEELNYLADENYNEMSRFWTKYFAPYIKTLKIEQKGNADSSAAERRRTMIYLADGVTLDAWNGGCMSFRLDINGKQKPNAWGKDIFLFHFCEKTFEQELYLGKNVNFGPNKMIEATDRDKALEICRDESNCGALLIMYDNFEFKKDYPVKF